MARVAPLKDSEKKQLGWVFTNPATGLQHEIYTELEEGWEYNGNADWPTFDPTIDIRYVIGGDSHEQRVVGRIADGVLTYDEGCTPPMQAGESEMLPDVYADMPAGEEMAEAAPADEPAPQDSPAAAPPSESEKADPDVVGQVLGATGRRRKTSSSGPTGG